MVIGVTLLILFVIAVGLWYFERMLARRPGKWAGLIMPIAFFILSVTSVVSAAPSVFSQMEATGGLGGAIATLALSFLLINLPTLLVYVVYFRTRQKMGERPWPLRSRSSDGGSNPPAQ